MADTPLDRPVDILNGTNFRDYQLKVDGPVWRFVPTLKPLIVIFAFLLLGGLMLLIVPAVEIPKANSMNDLIGTGSFIYLAIVAAYIWLARWVWRRSTKPRVFDLQQGLFYFGTKPGEQTHKLSEIDRLQVFCKAIYGERTSYYSYELNLVLKNKQRYKLMDHSEGKTLKQEAEQLAKVLKVDWSYIDFSDKK